MQVEKDEFNRIYSVSGDDVSGLVSQLQKVAGSHLDALQELKDSFFTTRDGLDALAPHELQTRILEGDVVLVDVLPEHEYAEGHLPGALSIPIEELQARLAELPDDKEVIAYCRGPFCTFSADAVLLETAFWAVTRELAHKPRIRLTSGASSAVGANRMYSS
ncbi:MAG: hypothetical protein GY822_00500 [Deltaproteobacteria bacterium]|nr:hypothetical protein [Deltaproteobacteria bacterium]